jgi:hypothetical protein
MAYIGKTPTIGNFQVCDAISVVNGQAAYTMQVNSVNVSPESANHMLVSLNGILQKPGSSYTVSGSTITFASNLVTGDVIDFIQILGNVLDLGVPSDATVSTAKIVDGAVTSAKLASGVGGKVLQVVTATDSTARTTTSTSYVTASSSLSVNITPASTSNKIFLICNTPVKESLNGETFLGTIFRDSTDIGGNGLGLHYQEASSNIRFPMTMCLLDSPSSSSQITYTARFKTSGGTATINEGNRTGTLTAFEVGA